MSSDPPSKPIRCSVAAVVRRRGDDRFLVVRRPPDDDLPDVWGLPAVTLGPGELPEQGVRRIGREKLAVELDPIRMIGMKSGDRRGYELILMDIEAVLWAGAPDVRAATSTATRYVDQRWTDDLEVLREAADKGSLCCQVLLDAAGVAF